VVGAGVGRMGSGTGATGEGPGWLGFHMIFADFLSWGVARKTGAVVRFTSNFSSGEELSLVKIVSAEAGSLDLRRDAQMRRDSSEATRIRLLRWMI